MAGRKLSNIEIWNAKVDKTSWVRRLGKQGILYEYRLPYGANPMKYYEDAIDVRSIKGNNNRKSSNGKRYRPGSYQPIGDKRYFNYYQMKKMSQKEIDDFLIEALARKTYHQLMGG